VHSPIFSPGIGICKHIVNVLFACNFCACNLGFICPMMFWYRHFCCVDHR